MHIKFLPYYLAPQNLPIVNNKLNNRIAIKNLSTIFLNYYKEDEILYSTIEFSKSSRYYTYKQKINIKNIKDFRLDDSISVKIAEQLFDILLEDYGKNSNIWVSGKKEKTYFVSPREEYIEYVLNKKNLKYKKYTESGMYLFYIYK